MSGVGVSILVLTLNEAQTLQRCLESVSWADDIVVLDSFSTDQTVSIARKYGARVVQREFDDYASQRNYGLNHIEYRNPWLLMVDADEVVPADLAEEIREAVAENDGTVGMYRMRRKDFFLGRWIKHASGYPTWFGRLMKLGRVWIEREVNEEYYTDGRIGKLSGHLHHYPFSKGFSAWFDRQNRYSSMEAELVVRGSSCNLRFRELVSSDAVIRRRALKALLYRMPARPALVFIGLYVLRGGFLDGSAGLKFCQLRAIYEVMIDRKVEEIRRRRAGLPI